MGTDKHNAPIRDVAWEPTTVLYLHIWNEAEDNLYDTWERRYRFVHPDGTQTNFLTSDGIVTYSLNIYGDVLHAQT